MNTLINTVVPQLYRLNPVAAALWLVPLKIHQTTFTCHHRDQNNDYKTNSTCRINIRPACHRLTSSHSATLTTIQIPIDLNHSITPRH